MGKFFFIAFQKQLAWDHKMDCFELRYFWSNHSQECDNLGLAKAGLELPDKAELPCGQCWNGTKCKSLLQVRGMYLRNGEGMLEHGFVGLKYFLPFLASFVLQACNVFLTDLGHPFIYRVLAKHLRCLKLEVVILNNDLNPTTHRFMLQSHA